MIQRVQTLYLLVAAILGVVLFFVGIAQFNYIEYEKSRIIVLSLLGRNQTDFNQISVLEENFVTIGVNAFVIFDCIAAIFLFKNRKTQIMLCKFISLAILVLTGLLAFSIYGLLNTQGLVSREFLSGSIFPLVMLILVNLAARSINKDENLVRSADRIR